MKLPALESLLRTRGSWTGASLLLSFLAFHVVVPASWADTSIGLYSDQWGQTCSFNGNAPGFFTAYVVVRPDVIAGVNSVQFAAPPPACLGAVYASEKLGKGMTGVGNSQTGISITLAGCSVTPVAVLEITYWRGGSTDPCCGYPISPHPGTGKISATSCASEEIPITSVVSRFNADATCECIGNSAPAPPSFPTPSDGATDVGLGPSLAWVEQDLDDNIVARDLYFGTDPSPPLLANGLTSPAYTLPKLQESTSYYWRVVVRDAFGLEASGPVWTFTTRANGPPIAPFDPAPSDAAQEVPSNPTLFWRCGDADLDPLVYDVYMGTSPSPPLIATGVAVANYSPGPLAFSTTYYWRIVARDDHGFETSGPEWMFTTRPANYPPGVPFAPSPANNATNVLLDATLAWQAGDPDGDPLVFDVYFGTSTPPPLVAASVPVRSFSPDSLAFSTQYYWRIVARDTVGAETSGPAWKFTTRPENFPPGFPNNPSPPDRSRNRVLNTTLAWQCTDPEGDPLTFDVYFGTTSPPPLVATDVPTASYAPGHLTPSTLHYWRIVARDAPGGTTSGPTWTFTTAAGNLPPNPPHSPSPPDGSTDQPLNPTLAWQCTDPEGDALTYDVYLGTTANPPLVATNVPTASYAPGYLMPTTQYYWKIVARDAGGYLATGPTWTFTTAPGNHPPNAPYGPTPKNNATGQPANITLAWNCTDTDGDPLTYDVYLGPLAPPPLVATGLPTPSYSPGQLLFGRWYNWRIVARDTVGATTSGPTWVFTTKYNSPPVLSNPVPAHNSVTYVSPVLSWTATDPDGQVLVHSVYFGATSPPPLVALGLSETHFDPGALPLGTYFWKVTTSDGVTTTIGPIWSFTLALPGDVVSDGVVDLSDAACAMETYLWDPSCGGPHAYILADVDCNTQVTPADARCIHQYVVDGSCVFCEGTRSAAPRRTRAATVTTGAVFTRGDTLLVRLSVDGVPSLGSFGFYTTADPKLVFLEARRRGPTAGFDVLETRTYLGSAIMGAYALSSVPVNSPAEFIEMEFDMSEGPGTRLVVDGFVDDLQGASTLIIPLDGVSSARPVASALVLHPNRPNPFNPQTTISYDLPAATRPVRVRLTIVDPSGRVVRTLVDEEQSEGPHEVRWEGRDANGEAVASGVYFCVLDVGGERKIRKLVLLK